MSGLFGAMRLPASVVFGSGQRAAIGMMTAGIGKRALICTDARMGQDAQFKAIVADIAANGVQVKAADLLGITFRQFRYLAKKYQLK